jgi:hypothetical protein
LKLKIIFIILFTSLYSNITAQTGKISGLIIDAETYKPISDVEIIIHNTSFKSKTNDEGAFTAGIKCDF